MAIVNSLINEYGTGTGQTIRLKKKKLRFRSKYGSVKSIRIRSDPDPQHWIKLYRYLFIYAHLWSRNPQCRTLRQEYSWTLTSPKGAHIVARVAGTVEIPWLAAPGPVEEHQPVHQLGVVHHIWNELVADRVESRVEDKVCHYVCGRIRFLGNLKNGYGSYGTGTYCKIPKISY